MKVLLLLGLPMTVLNLSADLPLGYYTGVTAAWRRTRLRFGELSLRERGCRLFYRIWKRMMANAIAPVTRDTIERR